MRKVECGVGLDRCKKGERGRGVKMRRMKRRKGHARDEGNEADVD